MVTTGSVLDDNGSEGTGPEAVHFFNRELPVCRGFARLNIQLPPDLVDEQICAPDVTGCARADSNDVLPARS